MPNSHSRNLPVRTSRSLLLRDFIVFQVKLAADGLRDIVAINLSIVAIVIDLLAGRERRFGLFYGVVRLSERFENWLKLHRMKGLGEDRAWEDLVHLPAGEADELIDRFEGLVQRKASEVRTERDPWDGEG